MKITVFANNKKLSYAANKSKTDEKYETKSNRFLIPTTIFSDHEIGNSLRCQIKLIHEIVVELRFKADLIEVFRVTEKSLIRHAAQSESEKVICIILKRLDKVNAKV